MSHTESYSLAHDLLLAADPLKAESRLESPACATGRIDKIAHVRMTRELKLDKLPDCHPPHARCIHAERMCATGFAITVLTGILPVRANNCGMQVT